MGEVRSRMRDDMARARNERDAGKVSLLQTLIAAIENAEAVDASQHDGASEVPRRDLSDEEIATIIRHEVHDLLQAAEEYEQAGNPGEAGRLRGLAATAEGYAVAAARDGGSPRG